MDVEGDGNCLARAIAVAVGKEQTDYMEIWFAILFEYENNPQRYQLDGDHFLQAVNRVRTDKQWLEPCDTVPDCNSTSTGQIGVLHAPSTTNEFGVLEKAGYGRVVLPLIDTTQALDSIKVFHIC